MRKIYFILQFTITQIAYVYAENVVPNSSFEYGDTDNYPHDFSQLPKTSNWQNFNTSDWFSTDLNKLEGRYINSTLIDDIPDYQVNATIPNVLQAHTGTHYIGFGPCEGAQVELNEAVGQYNVVQISFWFSPRSKNDTEINVYLLEDEASGGALNNCANPDLDFEFHKVITVNSQGGDAIHEPGTWYYYTSEPFVITTDIQYEWLAIKGRNVDGTLYSKEYVYIDDVEFRSQYFCDYICTPRLGSITHSTPPENMIGNTNSTFRMLIENAVGLKFTVWSGESQPMYTYECVDLKGLKDEGFTDFLLEWNGNSDFGGNIYNDVYNYSLELWNCTEPNFFPIYRGLNVVTTTEAFVIPEVHNYDLEECCIDSKYFQNITINGYNRTGVDNFIKAGSNVTPGPQGPVVISQNANVFWTAGNFIQVDDYPDFEVVQGAEFEAVIMECADVYKTEPISRMKDFVYYAAVPSIQIKIIPNPNNGIFTIQANTTEAKSITVQNLLGNTVYQNKANMATNQEIDLREHSVGVYVVKVQTISGQVFVEKIVYK
jgi:hypothetical protein